MKPRESGGIRAVRLLLRADEMRSRLSAIPLYLLIVACGAGDGTGSSSQATTPPPPVGKNDCGSVIFGSGAAWCPADREAKFGCFLEAKRTCTSSRIGITYTSDEGGLTLTDLVIDDACKVFVRTDNTDDQWAAKPGITTTTCTGVSRIATGEGGKCSSLRVDECL